MRFHFKIISVFLLIGIGFSLMAEISHSSETHKSDSYSFQNESQPNTNSENSNCQDGCHIGGCHLSHCSPFLSFNSDKIGFYSALLNKYPIKFNFLAPDSPLLEGLKRPPRIS